jgi:hypothetical protein
MRIWTIFVLVSLFLSACSDNSKNTALKNNILKYIPDDISYYSWRPKQNQSSTHLIELTLKNGPKYVTTYKYGSCKHFYSIKLTNDSTVELIWDFQENSENCPADTIAFGFLYNEKSVGINEYPKQGETFSTYTLINDTTLRVMYSFPEWIKKINVITKDSIFPTYLYLTDSFKLAKPKAGEQYGWW